MRIASDPGKGAHARPSLQGHRKDVVHKRVGRPLARVERISRIDRVRTGLPPLLLPGQPLSPGRSPRQCVQASQRRSLARATQGHR